MQNTTTSHEFVRLLKEHQPLIYKICNLYGNTVPDREDLFQEIIVQSWKSYPKFRGDASFSTWLYRIALNTAISGFRRKKAEIIYVEPRQLPTDVGEENDNKEKEEQLQQLYGAIRQLSEIDRALVMLYLEDKSYEDMEDILGINQNTLRVKMNRVKEKLRKLINSDEYGVRTA